MQIRLIPVNKELHLAHVQELKDLFFKGRPQGQKSMTGTKNWGYKIREAQTQKIPYQLVIGDKEVEKGILTYRRYGSSETVTVTVREFVEMIKEEISSFR